MKSQSILFVALMFALVAVPGAVSAQENDEARPERQGGFCTVLSQIGDRIDTRTDEARARLDERYSSAIAELEAKWADRDAERAERRAEADIRREDMYGNLRDRAEGDDQEAAVGKFETTVEGAVVVRRDTVDGAVDTARTDGKALADVRKGEIGDGIDGHETIAEGALGEAETACAEDGSNGVEIREEFQSTVEEARESLRAEREAMREAFKAERESLIETRRATIDVAIETFRSTLEGAKVDLKTAFGE